MGDGFANFPLDTQRCYLVMESCGYSISEVRLSWLPWNPVSVASERLQLPDFRFVNLTYEQRMRRYSAGAFDQLKITFHFKRLYGYYIVQVGVLLNSLWNEAVVFFNDRPICLPICLCLSPGSASGLIDTRCRHASCFV